MKPHWIRTLLLLPVIACLAGCATSPKRQGIARLNLAKQGAMFCIMYADDHGGRYPTSFLATTAGFSFNNTNFLNQLTADFDLVYSGGATNITKPSETIIIREKQAWQWPRGRWAKAYAFADGHAEIHAAPDGQFDDWENARIVKP